MQKPNRKYAIKIEQLYQNADGTYESYNEITQYVSNSSGQLDISLQNGIRRKISFTIVSPDYKINPEGKIWLDSIFRLWYGLEISDGNIYWISQGIFVLDDSSSSSASSSEHSISINAVDKCGLLDGSLSGVLEASYSVVNGNSLKDSIKSIIVDSGDNSPINIDSVYDGYNISYNVILDLGSTYTDLLDKLAEFRTSNYFYDTSGSFQFVSGIEDIDDSQKPVMYSFSNDGTDVNYISSDIKYNIEKVKNYIKVVGNSTDTGITFCGASYNDDPSSPTSISRIGRRNANPITIDDINSDEYCKDRALYELKQIYRTSVTVSINSLSLPHLTVGDVIELTDSHHGIDHQKLLINSINFDLKDGGQMALSCSNIFDIDYNANITGEIS